LVSKGKYNFQEMMQPIMAILMEAMGLGPALTDMADVKVGREATNRVLDLVYSEDQQINSLAFTGARLSDVKGEIEERVCMCLSVSLCMSARAFLCVARHHPPSLFPPGLDVNGLLIS